MKRFIRPCGAAVLAFAIGSPVCWAGGSDPSVAELNGLLAKAASYQEGESWLALGRIDSLLQRALPYPERLRSIEAEFIRFLGSNVSVAAKQFICQKLSAVGTDASVPVLTKLLKNGDTFGMALFALERMPSLKAGDALRKQLPKADGRMKTGLIHALGYRKDAKAVKPLMSALQDANPEWVLASVVALGEIATPEAVEALWKGYLSADPSLKTRILFALQKSADAMAVRGQKTEAVSLEERLLDARFPATVRRAAFNALCDLRPEAMQAFCLSTIQGNDPELQTAAIQQAKRIKDDAFQQSIAKRLPQLDATRQIQMIAAFSEIRCRGVLGDVAAMKDQADAGVRRASIEALGILGDASTVPVLLDLAVNGDETARRSLAALPGKSVDSALLASLASAASVPAKTELVRVLGERLVAGAVDPISASLTDPDSSVRVAAAKAMGRIATPDRIPALLGVLVQAKNRSEHNTARDAVIETALRVDDPSLQIKAVLDLAAATKDARVKASLVEILGKLGNPGGLPTIRNGLSDKSLDIQRAALAAFSGWPTAEPMPDLLAFYQNSKDEPMRLLALRGYVRSIGLSDLGDGEKTAKYRQAFEWSAEWPIRRMILSALNDVGSSEAFALIESCLDDASLKSEAETAALRWANRNWEKDTNGVKRVMRKIAQASSDPENAANAKAWLKRLGE